VTAGQATAGRGLRARRRRAGSEPVRRLLGAPSRVFAILPPRAKRWLIVAVALALVVAVGYRFWLRDSSFVTVEQVTVTGLTTKDAPRVRASLASAAHTMTTLHVRHEVLEQAIAAYPVVRALDVRPDFPHGLTIRVIEYQPAALVGGLPVAGDGTILRGIPVERSLPTIETRGAPHGNRLTDPTALHAARIAGTAPAALRSRLERIEMRAQDGLVVHMRDGPELIFGDATRARAKWIAATRVLADPEAEGASYIDVRLPAPRRRPRRRGRPPGPERSIRPPSRSPRRYPTAIRPRRRPTPSRRPLRPLHRALSRRRHPPIRPAAGAPRRQPGKLSTLS
jgi:cell division protein FtsQ